SIYIKKMNSIWNELKYNKNSYNHLKEKIRKGKKMMTKRYNKFETAVIHEGYDEKEMLGSLAVPLFQTSTYVFDSAEQGERRFAGEEPGYMYSRLGNPTVHVL